MLVFGNPIFLLGTGAVLVPVVIHILFRKKARKIRFPSLLLITLVRKKVTRYHRLKEFLLLLLRMGVIALIALALARPFIPGFGNPEETLVLFVIDDSLSMGQVCEGISMLEQGTEFAYGIINTLEQGSRCGYVLASLRDGGIKDPAPDLEYIREQLSKIKPTGARVSLAPACERALRIAQREAGTFCEIYIISDRRETVPDSLEIGKNISLFYADCYRDEPVANIRITSVEVPRGPFPALSEIEVTAELENQGDKDITGELIFSVGETSVHKDTSVNQGEKKQVAFTTLPLKQGIHRGSVVFSEDCVEGDSVRYFSIRTGNPMRVLFIGTEKKSSSEEKKFVESALNPWKKGMETFISDYARIELITPERLREYELLICCSFIPVIDAHFTMVQEYIKQGGSCILVPSSDYDPESFNVQVKLRGSLMPWRIRSIEKTAGTVKLGRIDYSYPAFRSLRNLIAPETADFSKRIDIELQARSALTVCAEFDDRKPAIISNRYGRGEIVFFCWGFTEEWTDAPYRNFFAPLIHELAGYLCRGNSVSQRRYAAGTPLSFKSRSDYTNVSVTVPGREAPVELPGSRGMIMYDTFTPGFYSCTYRGDRGELKREITVNPALDENLGDVMHVHEITAALNIPLTRIVSPERGSAVAIARARKGSGLRSILLTAGIILLVLELILANRMAVRKWKVRTDEQENETSASEEIRAEVHV